MTPFLGAWERLVLMRDGYYSADKRRSRRAAMLLALDRGNSAATVARMSGCSRTTVYYWLHLYKQYRDVAVFSPATNRQTASPQSFSTPFIKMSPLNG
jgi:transposase-like protein